MQYPPLPVPPDLNYVIHQVTPLAVLALTFVGVRWVFRSPVGEAIAERIRTRVRGGSRWSESTGEEGHRMAALEEQVSHLQTQLSELAERVDFAERMLAERGERKLGAGQ